MIMVCVCVDIEAPTTCAYTKNGRKAALGGDWESAQLSVGLHRELLTQLNLVRKSFACGLLPPMVHQDAEQYAERIQRCVDNRPVTARDERLMELVARCIGHADQNGQPECSRS